ncbi:alpha-amylase family glycosyl hydrolase [Herbinix luporum]|uniref:Glycosyl hydrolase family 13 catalytic domain-containing protein n=1 Tax=Herbinix luporum TaxID=1679721 RepID=A0A0K8J427_9FIRM|nr:alpha-amylase family glycosyl hydrolase [Herbinix luporum]CUH92222.1 hypothetical protein SD1D_0674 [Herbinix luporum]
MKFLKYLGFIIILMYALIGCNKHLEKTESEQLNEEPTMKPIEQSENTQTITVPEYKYRQKLNIIDDNYRTYYEVFLYSFYDSNGDGIGDINGLIEKLDYINDGKEDSDTSLGFNGIWLMPIMPSASYHKYDVQDYYDIDPEYGTLDDFKKLVDECNKRGIKLIIDLVINHTSNMHPWFVSALKSLNIDPCGQEICRHEKLCREHNPYVDYYNFVEGKPDRSDYYHTGIGDWYYEGVFSQNMPDLNLANTDLRKDIEDIMKYWLDFGIGGFRLDAALHYFSDDTEKNCEVLSWLNDFIKSYNENHYMVAEVWTNFRTFSRYYASNIDSVFNFAFAMESGKITKTLNYKGFENTAKAFGEAMIQVQKVLDQYSKSTIDAPFFTNHDTARAAGYFMYDPVKTKMAGGMNLMMSGNVFVYYGEELGMSGAGKDENKRAPMYWFDDYKKNGMTKGPKDMDKVDHHFGSFEKQMKDPLSIYNYYKRAVRLRNENPEIARGIISYMTEISDQDICAISKTYKDSTIYMLYNISEEEKVVTVPKNAYTYKDIRGYLSANGEEVTLDDDKVTLPAYSIVILK